MLHCPTIQEAVSYPGYVGGPGNETVHEVLPQCTSLGWTHCKVLQCTPLWYVILFKYHGIATIPVCSFLHQHLLDNFMTKLSEGGGVPGN